METTTTTTTFTKLRSGSWGLKGTNLIAGATVLVTKKSGETKSVTIARILGQHQGLDYATIAAAAPSRSSRPRGYSSPRSACRCDGQAGGDCCGRNDCWCYDCQ